MEEIKIGDSVQVKKRFTKADVELFATLTGDYNPVHFDEEYAANTIFKKPIVHGPLVITLLTTIFAKDLPGPGTVYLSHDVRYLHPVYIDEEVVGSVEVIEITKNKHIIVRTICVNKKGNLILEGIARLKRF